jgi:hypothetical protein
MLDIFSANRMVDALHQNIAAREEREEKGGENEQNEDDT